MVEEFARQNGGSDPLSRQNSDHLGMILVKTLVTGNNYLPWHHLTIFSLGAKVKLGFINGKCKRPIETSADFNQWRRVDCMVLS